jgi:hypothetical protein
VNDRPWWVGAIPLVVGIVATLVMGRIMGWLSSSRSRPSISPKGRLVAPRSVIISAWVGALFFAGLCVLSVVFRDEDVPLWTTLVFGFFAMLGFYMVVECYRARHELQADGLVYGDTLGRGGLARWEQIVRVRYSDTGKWFRLDLTDGRVVRLSAMLQGLPEFAKEVLARVPQHTMDEKTRALLEDTAAGNLPSVW